MPVDVKICGLTSPGMLDVAIEAGAAYAGLVFHATSPRNISHTQAAHLVEHGAGRAKMVALLVDPTDEELKAVCERVRPDMVQLHGSETVERVQAVRTDFRLPVIKAIGVGSAEDAQQSLAYEEVADLILFDTKLSDWHLVKGVLKRPFMLAGGLVAGNVQTAIARSGAQAVDVSSGVEITRGNKDAELIREFIAAAHGAGR